MTAHDQTGELDGGAWPLFETLQSTAIGLLAGAICVMPRVAPWMLTGLALLYVAANLGGARSLVKQALAGVAPVATLLVPGLGVLSTLWSNDRWTSFATAITALLLTVVTLVLLAAVGGQMSRLPAPWRRRFLRAIPLGGLAGLGFLVIETLTGYGLTRRVLTAFPGLAGERGKGLRLDGDQVAEIVGFFSNRNVAGLTLLAIPLLLATWMWLGGQRRWIVSGLAGACVVLVVFGSDSETAKVALVTGGLTILAARRWPRQTMFGLAGALALGLLFTVTLARLPLYLKLHEASWLAYSHRDRVLIWDTNAEIAGQNPILGAGVEAARIIQEKINAERRQAARTRDLPRESRRLALHAHNFYVQIRLDLGFAGSLVALAFGLAMIAGATRLHPRLVAWGMGLIAATMASAISGWGLWQYWFLAGLGADTVFLALIDAELRHRQQAGA